MKWWMTAAAVAMVAESSLAHAGIRDGNSLYYKCMTAASDPTYFQQRAGCYDYVVGVSDMILDFPAISGIKPTVCYPNGVTAGQIVGCCRTVSRQPPSRATLHRVVNGA
jgi:hypothetical protein